MWPFSLSLNPAADLAADWWSDRLEKGDKDIFRREISKLIHKALTDHDGKPVYIECDYDPCYLLLQGLKKAGVKCSGSMFSADGILPEKHLLIVYPDRIVPKEGYRNWTTEIRVE